MNTRTNQTCKLLSAKQLAKDVLSVSPRTVWRLRSAGKLPRPVEVGSSIRWIAADIDKWIALGCPPQRDFEALAE